MEVAAMVTAINPAISSTADSLDMAVLQQVLSVDWLLQNLSYQLVTGFKLFPGGALALHQDGDHD